MKFDEYKNWNEYNWECELRKQDKCISTYMYKLNDYIDLPNETELVLKKLEKKGLINSKAVNRSDLFIEEKDISELFLMDTNNSSYNLKLFSKLGSLASEFNMVLTGSTNSASIIYGIKILSNYGKLISIFLDYIDIEENTLSSLKTALSKRIISSINILIGQLQQMSTMLPDFSKDLKKQINELLFIREVIIDFRYKCRTVK